MLKHGWIETGLRRHSCSSHSLSSGSDTSQDSLTLDDEEEDISEDDHSSRNTHKDDEDDIEDLPTVERPYSKILSFHYQTKKTSGATQTEKDNGPTYQIRNTRWSRVSAELKQVVMRRSCCQDRQVLHSHKSQCHTLLKPHANQGLSVGKNTMHETYISFCIVTRTIVIRIGTGSKNLSFLKQQLADQVRQNGTVSEVIHVFSCPTIHHRPYPRPRTPLAHRQPQQQQYRPKPILRNDQPKDFNSIPDIMPIPRSLNDFDMSLFRDISEEPYALEWEYVEELLKTSGLNGCPPSIKLDLKNSQLIANAEKAVQEVLLQDLLPHNRNSLIRSLLENHFKNLV